MEPDELLLGSSALHRNWRRLSCGGYFKADGRAVKLGKWAGKTSGFTSAGGVPHNKLLASLSNAMGVPVQSFGEAKYTGTLDTELHA
jgi:hypothetical protein